MELFKPPRGQQAAETHFTPRGVYHITHNAERSKWWLYGDDEGCICSAKNHADIRAALDARVTAKTK